MRGSLVLAAVVAVGFLEGSASAQDAKPGRTETSVDVMVFPDDKLLTTPTFPDEAKIGAAHKPVRTLLVRPRLHFVPELLKTIENL